MATYRNPVISGFHPDPSVCRAGDDYFLVNSSFQYVPGVPLFHSKDLVHWKQIGHCLTSDEQLNVAEAHSSGGIYAPTIRHHDGRFYMTTTNVSGGGNFFVWTADPFGKWSNPLFIDHPGIDPDLFFDRDGTVYYTTSYDQAIYQSKVDLTTGKRLTEPKLIWRGTGGQYPESPHIFAIGQWYYLFIAEGGTEYGHMETVARSKHPEGPYESCPSNPIMTHRSLLSPIQATGHADFVQTPDGDWWAVFLGIRPVGYPNRHHLGRETFLAPVTWLENGWPVIGDNGRVYEEMSAGNLSLQHSKPLPPVSVWDDFDQPVLAPEWNFMRSASPERWSLCEKASCLTLYGASASLDDGGAPAFLGRKQQHFACRVSSRLIFTPLASGEEAGLTLYMNEKFHYDLALVNVSGERKVIFRRRLGSLWKVENELPWFEDSVCLTIQADKERYAFGISRDDSEALWLGFGECAMLATEVAGGFTGVLIAMYATGNGKPSTTPAHFDWFEYAEL
ncbi:glycoside hydrolase family 43 protein [Paenibacillus sp. CAU 1782]